MRYLYFFFLFLLYQEGTAQSNYIPFPEDEAVWHVAIKYPSAILPNHDQHMYAGDTTINGFSYHKLNHKAEYVILPTGGFDIDDEGTIGFIRQDSLSRKVYYLPSTDTVEQLLYDFRLGVKYVFPL